MMVRLATVRAAVQEELAERELHRELLIFGGILLGIIGFVVYLLYYADSSHGTYWLLAEFALGLIIYWKSN